MSTQFITVIRKLREQAKLSQQDVADAVGIARATYVKLENGGREPKQSEIMALAKYYEISPLTIMTGEHFVEEPAAVYTRPVNKPKSEGIIPRDIDPKTNPEKLREVLLYVLGKIGAKPNVGETVLYKLLYFIDFDYYEKTGKSITGLGYIRNHFGPTPSRDFETVVESMKANEELEIIETKYYKNTLKKYLPLKDATLDNLSAKELQHIDETLARLGDKTATELSQLSHYDTPWLTAREGKIIAYRGVFYRTSLTAVTEPEDEL